MRDGNLKKSKLSWPKSLVKKWLNIQSKDGDFHADDVIYSGVDEECMNNFSEKSKTEKSNTQNRDHPQRNKFANDSSQITDVQNYRIFAATWNVGGRSPPSCLNLEEWLHASPPSDVYVLGFQEIVPLNAGNVLGTEDNGPARKWHALIRKTLNNLPGDGGGGDDFEGSNREKDSFAPRHSMHSMSRSMRMVNITISAPQPILDHRFSVCDRVIYGNKASDHYYDPTR